MDSLVIAGKSFTSRLFLGSGKFSSALAMQEAIKASGTQLVTVALKRVSRDQGESDISGAIKACGVELLPNTAGAYDAKQAILAAHLAREALETNWLKLEIHPDPRYLMPDPIETLRASEELVKAGFIVLPYVHADPVLCKRLEEVGVAAVMPLAAPIGSNKGLSMRAMLEIIIEQALVPVIVDAGLGAPSHAAEALEMGAGAVLVNTAIAAANNPAQMADAFRLAVESGRIARSSGLARTASQASASSPIENSFVLNSKLKDFLKSEHVV